MLYCPISFHVKVFNLLYSGALTKGDRRAASGVDLSEFNFDTPYGRSSLRAVYSAICQVIFTAC